MKTIKPCASHSQNKNHACSRLAFTRPGRAMLLGSSGLQLWSSQQPPLLLIFTTLKIAFILTQALYIPLNIKLQTYEIMSYNTTKLHFDEIISIPPNTTSINHLSKNNSSSQLPWNKWVYENRTFLYSFLLVEMIFLYHN